MKNSRHCQMGKAGLIFMLISIIVLTSFPVSAVTVAWNKTQGGLWNTSTNWMPVKVPAPEDDVVISSAGSGTITVDSEASAKTLMLSGAYTIALSSGKFTIANDIPSTHYTGTITLTRKGNYTDAGNVEHTLDETCELSGVTLDKIYDDGTISYWQNPTGINISTTAAINDSDVDATSSAYFQITSTTFTQWETVINLDITTPLPPLSGEPAGPTTYQLAVTDCNVNDVKATIWDADNGSSVNYITYPIPGQVAENNILISGKRLTGTVTEYVNSIPWTMTWDFIGN